MTTETTFSLPSSSTDRISFRPATAADADTTWAYRGLPEVYAWLPVAPHSRDEWAAMLAEPVRLARTMVLEHEGAVIGDLYLHVYDAWCQRDVADGAKGAQAEIGWALDPAYGGRGLASEAAIELLRVCFTDLGIHRVVATCYAGNEPSWRLMERIGMRRETYAVKEALHRTHGWVDTVGYAVLDDEWRARTPSP